MTSRLRPYSNEDSDSRAAVLTQEGELLASSCTSSRSLDSLIDMGASQQWALLHQECLFPVIYEDTPISRLSCLVDVMFTMTASVKLCSSSLTTHMHEISP
jgi:hypothetical protein